MVAKNLISNSGAKNKMERYSDLKEEQLISLQDRLNGQLDSLLYQTDSLVYEIDLVARALLILHSTRCIIEFR